MLSPRWSRNHKNPNKGSREGINGGELRQRQNTNIKHDQRENMEPKGARELGWEGERNPHVGVDGGAAAAEARRGGGLLESPRTRAPAVASWPPGAVGAVMASPRDRSPTRRLSPPPPSGDMLRPGCNIPRLASASADR